MLIPQPAALRDIFCTNEEGLILMVRQQAGILRSAASNRPAFRHHAMPLGQVVL